MIGYAPLDCRAFFVMATDKNSFILYTDIIHTVNKLPDEKAGKLFKIILEYVNDLNPNTTEDLLVDIAFEPIKQILKRDLKKWTDYKEKQSVNGQKGGRPKKNQKTQAFLNKPKKAANVSVSVNVNDNVINNNIINKELSKDEITNTIEFIQITAQKKINENQVKEFYTAFCINNKNHLNREDKITHFRNWLKKQDNETTKESIGKSIVFD